LPTAECSQWFVPQIIRGDHEYATRFRIRRVDDLEDPPGSGGSDRDSGLLSAGSIFDRIPQYFFDFLFRDPMPSDMRFLGEGVDVEAEVHRVIVADSVR
jgi:hypothetical protein